MKNGIRDLIQMATMTYTNGTGVAIASGAVVAIGTFFGIAKTNIAIGAVGAVEVLCVAELAKATHNTDKPFAQGEAVFWDATNSRCDKAGTAGAKYIGTAEVAVGSLVATIQVRMNDAPKENFAKIPIDSTAAALNSSNGRVDIVTGLGRAPSAIFTELLTASTLLKKTGYKVDLATTAGTIRIDGVGSGTQLDDGDMLYVKWAA